MDSTTKSPASTIEKPIEIGRIVKSATQFRIPPECIRQSTRLKTKKRVTYTDPGGKMSRHSRLTPKKPANFCDRNFLIIRHIPIFQILHV